MMISSEALEAARLIDRLERLARAVEQVGRLNPAQWDALRYLARANRFSRTPATLADYLASTRGTVSRTLASLESKGFIGRTPSRRDGRSVDFAVTATGTKALKRDPLFALAEEIERAAGGEIGGLLHALRKVLRQAIAHNNGRAFGECFSCRHFRAGSHPATRTPHHCALLDERLSDQDSKFICVEHEPVMHAG